MAAVEWFELNAALLMSLGVEVRLVGPSTDTNKNSVQIDFFSPQLLVMVSIWDSWECDLGILDIEQEPEGDIAWEVLELAGSLDARILLDRIASRYLGFVEGEN